MEFALSFVDGSEETNLKDAMYENLSTDDIMMIEAAINVVFQIATGYIGGAAGRVLQVIDRVDQLSNLAIAAGNLNKLGNHKDITVREGNMDDLEKVMDQMRDQFKPDILMKGLIEDNDEAGETHFMKYKMGLNEAFPLSPMFQELDLFFNDERGFGAFYLINSVYTYFAGTFLLRDFYSTIKNVNMSDPEEVLLMKTIWATIREVAMEETETETPTPASSENLETGDDVKPIVAETTQTVNLLGVAGLSLSCCCVICFFCVFFLCAAVLL